MGVSQIFKAASRRVADFWDDLRHSAVNPVPEIRKELEDKGYKFTHERSYVMSMGFHGAAVPVSITQIHSPDGKLIDAWEGDDARSVQYRHDYSDALARYKAARRGPSPAP